MRYIYIIIRVGYKAEVTLLYMDRTVQGWMNLHITGKFIKQLTILYVCMTCMQSSKVKL
jgi:hypothetical protein